MATIDGPTSSQQGDAFHVCGQSVRMRGRYQLPVLPRWERWASRTIRKEVGQARNPMVY
jgi:hypothetical protein